MDYPKEDLYGILGVAPDADRSEIIKAWRKKLAYYHPDKPSARENVKQKFAQKPGESGEQYEVRITRQMQHIMAVLNRAKDELTDDSKRSAYNLWREKNQKSAGANPSQDNRGQNQKGASGRSGSSTSNSGQQSGTGGNNRKTYRDGRFYEGEFSKSGKRHGFGRMKYTDGCVYEGEWKHGQRHGTGRFAWDNGEFYEGTFVKGEITGTGKYCWPDGRNYEGDFVNGDMHGRGKMIWPDGREYDGEWANDFPNGQGTMTYPGGRQESGYWNFGQFQGGQNQNKNQNANTAAGAGSGNSGRASGGGNQGNGGNAWSAFNFSTNPGSAKKAGTATNYSVRPFVLRDPIGFFTTEYGVENGANGPQIFMRKNILGGLKKPPKLDFNRLSSAGSDGIFFGDVTFQTVAGTTDVAWENVWAPGKHRKNIEDLQAGKNVRGGGISANLVSIFASVAIVASVAATQFSDDEPKRSYASTHTTIDTKSSGLVKPSNKKTTSVKKSEPTKPLNQTTTNIKTSETAKPSNSVKSVQNFPKGKYYVAWNIGNPLEVGSIDDISKGTRLVKSPFSSKTPNYEGAIVNNTPHGQGTYKLRSGGTYTGDFQYGIMSGLGVHIKSDGSKYEGFFAFNRYFGKGTYTYADGRKYVGNWSSPITRILNVLKPGDLESYKLGKGTFTWPDGRKYVGNWISNMPGGEGTFTSAEGEIFRGQWNSGCLIVDKKTIALFSDPNECGSTASGKKTQSTSPAKPVLGPAVTQKNTDGDGQRRIYDGPTRYQAGKIIFSWDKTPFHYKGPYLGTEASGVPHGKGVYDEDDGALHYEGYFTMGKIAGEGVLTLANTDNKYEGHFRDNDPDGHGKAYFSDKGTYEGNWRKGKPHGDGTYRDNRTGCKLTGKWVNGKFEKGGVRLPNLYLRSEKFPSFESDCSYEPS